VTKTPVGVIILKMGIITFLRKISVLVPINGHDLIFVKKQQKVISIKKEKMFLKCVIPGNPLVCSCWPQSYWTIISHVVS
jgi:hypothetical protein